MLFAIDVGNTSIVFGVFSGKSLTASWRLSTHGKRTPDELGLIVLHMLQNRAIDVKKIDAVILCSVVPPLTGTVVEMVRNYVQRDALLVESGEQMGISVLYESDTEVGADRLVNGVAAFELHGRSRGTAVIVVDFGTATTFDAISVSGEYLGGVICPGVQISADALFQRTALLPRVEIKRPSTVIGRTTTSSVQSGLYFGQISMIEGIVRRIRSELVKDIGTAGSASEHATCIATGGIAQLIAEETGVFEKVDGDLTLHGLRIIWERNLSWSRQ